MSVERPTTQNDQHKLKQTHIDEMFRHFSTRLENFFFRFDNRIDHITPLE